MVARIDMLMEGRLDAAGNEVPDNTPLSIPAGFKRPEKLEDQIRRLIRNAVADADRDKLETFEESEDFDIDDDMFDPSSPYEEVFDPVLGRGITVDEFRRNEEVYRKRYLEAEQKAYEMMERSEALRARPKAAPPAEQSGPKAAQAAPAGGSPPDR